MSPHSLPFPGHDISLPPVQQGRPAAVDTPVRAAGKTAASGEENSAGSGIFQALVDDAQASAADPSADDGAHKGAVTPDTASLDGGLAGADSGQLLTAVDFTNLEIHIEAGAQGKDAGEEAWPALPLLAAGVQGENRLPWPDFPAHGSFAHVQLTAGLPGEAQTGTEFELPPELPPALPPALRAASSVAPVPQAGSGGVDMTAVQAARPGSAMMPLAANGGGQADGEGAAELSGEAGTSREVTSLAALKIRPALTQAAGSGAQAKPDIALSASGIAPGSIPGPNIDLTAQMPANEALTFDTARALDTQLRDIRNAASLDAGSARLDAMREQIAVAFARNAQTGTRDFHIRLEPPELGRVDVRMQLSIDGRVTAHLIIERPETLDFLMRDQRGLERALEHAGVRAESGGLNFSLKREGSGFFDGRGERNGSDEARHIANTDPASPEPGELPGRRLLARIGPSPGGIDIEV